MSLAVEAQPEQPRGFVGLLQSPYGFVGMCSEPNKLCRCISERPELDIRIAQAAAESFAKDRNLLYKGILKDPPLGVITVIQCGSTWFPLTVSHNAMVLLTKWEGLIDLGGDKEKAVRVARGIASTHETMYIEEMGSCLGL